MASAVILIRVADGEPCIAISPEVTRGNAHFDGALVLRHS